MTSPRSISQHSAASFSGFVKWPYLESKSVSITVSAMIEMELRQSRNGG